MKELFKGSKPLTQEESKVLEKTFKRVVKTIPTLPKRK